VTTSTWVNLKTLAALAADAERRRRRGRRWLIGAATLMLACSTMDYLVATRHADTHDGWAVYHGLWTRGGIVQVVVFGIILLYGEMRFHVGRHAVLASLAREGEVR